MKNFGRTKKVMRVTSDIIIQQGGYVVEKAKNPDLYQALRWWSSSIYYQPNNSAECIYSRVFLATKQVADQDIVAMWFVRRKM
jgi:hypothetical protein